VGASRTLLPGGSPPPGRNRHLERPGNAMMAGIAAEGSAPSVSGVARSTPWPTVPGRVQQAGGRAAHEWGDPPACRLRQGGRHVAVRADSRLCPRGGL